MSNNEQTKTVIVEFKNKNEKTVIDAFDKLNEGLNQTDSKTKDVVDGLNKMGTEGTSSTESLTGAVFKGNVAFGALQAGVNIAIDVIKKGFEIAKEAVVGFYNITKQAIETFVNLAIEGDAIGDVMGRFNSKFKDSGKVLDSLRKSTSGVVTDFDLMQRTNQVLAMNVTKDTDKIAKIWEIARAKAEELNLSTTDAFDQIVAGINRQAPVILSKVGISTDAYQKQIDTLKARGITMTEAQQKELMLANVIAQSKDLVAAETDAFEQVQVKAQNFKDTLEAGLTPVLNDLATVAMPLVDGAVKLLNDGFAYLQVNVFPKVVEAAKVLRDFFISWWNENKDTVVPKIEEMGRQLGLLGGAFNDLLNPSDLTKQSLKNLVTEGVNLVIDQLIGNKDQKGLITLVTDMISEMGKKENIDNMTKALGELNTTLGYVRDAIDWIGKHKSDIEWAIKGLGLVVNPVGFVKDVIDTSTKNDNSKSGLTSDALAKAAAYDKTYSDVNYSAITAITGTGKTMTNAAQNLISSAHKQSGGLTTESKPYTINEVRNEKVYLPAGSTIDPNPEQKKGDIIINILAPVNGVNDLKNIIFEAVKQAQLQDNYLGRLKAI